MKQVITGNTGPRIRSDIEVTLELTETGGIELNLKSKVKTMYGKAIERQCRDLLHYFGIENARLSMNDSGALPFVIAARIEAAVKALTGTEKCFIPEMAAENLYASSRDRFRFSRLYLPGNSPGMFLNAGLHSPDGVILDLEDSVAPERKDEARILVRNALRVVNFYGAERMIRINQGERGLDDLEMLIPHNVHLVLIPKCEDAETVRKVDNRIREIKAREGQNEMVFLMPIIESAAGVEHAMEIATAAKSVVAMAIGLEDYTADLGVQRTKEGKESLYARNRLVVASKAAGIQPIDSVFSDVGDMEGLLNNVLSAKAMGFEGMGCIHPRQIAVIREGFSPSLQELEKAKKIVIAYRDALEKGLGVVALGTKMIDPPVVARAEKTITLAVRLGLLPENWIDLEESKN
ncbi:MAG: aldolase/citrate lyase family protein [Bacteroidales bacterium]|jgi:citrate lyase subunit beta/citryl-CoA lyase|nr:citrate lyase subunit beta [Bacteroidales bacterium]MBP8708921.1 citrate lyase subunit beta [Bacteroidales bacterium]